MKMSPSPNCCTAQRKPRQTADAMTLSLSEREGALPGASFTKPKGLSSQRLEVRSFPSGLNLNICELSLQKPIAAPFVVQSEPSIFAIGFLLSGAATFEYYGRRRRKTNSYSTARSMFYNVWDDGQATYWPSGPIRFLSIIFTAKVLHRLVGEDIALLPKACHDADAPPAEEYVETFSTLTPSMQLAAHQAMRCPQAGPLSSLFLESKVLELITLYTAGLASVGQGTRAGSITPDERERLHAARDILVAEVAEPPSIAALSRRVGLNECKLKRLFKSCFKTTIYGLVRAERMRKAKELLDGGMSVSQAASELGFANYSHFAASFRKYHGELPSRFRRH